MKNMMKIFMVGFVFVVFTGCATTGPKFMELSQQHTQIPSNTGRIYFYRTAILGAALQPDVKVNGDPVGSAVPNGFFYVDLKPGNYEIMTSTEVDRKLSLTMEKAQTRYVRLNVSMGFFVGHVYPELIDPDEGKKDMQNLHYTGKES